MTSVVSFVIWIICICISVIMIGYVIKYRLYSDVVSEGFSTNIHMTSCPLKSESYITGSGDTNCCDGDVVNKKCNGDIICSLSPNPPRGIQSCSEWMMNEWNKRSNRFCPKSMPNYFGPIRRIFGSVEGCSESPSSEDGSKPENAASANCKIYSTEELDRVNINSCFNANQLASLVPGAMKATQISLPISGPMPECLDMNVINNTIIPFLQSKSPAIASVIQKDPCSISGIYPICGMNCAKPSPKIKS